MEDGGLPGIYVITGPRGLGACDGSCWCNGGGGRGSDRSCWCNSGGGGGRGGD